VISYYGGECLVNFERYAQVLSQNFNVRIYLDGTRAETHQDNSIHLPNIKNISESELDCLYAILLHEIGHVKFTHVSRTDLKKMKGRDHFGIWNAIEDARIENKLMTKLEGAGTIFENFYGNHFDKFAKKIFGIEFDENVDPWHLFGIHVHDYLLNTKNKTLNITRYPEKIQNEVLKIFAKAKPLIDARKIVKVSDAISLAGKLFKELGPKRPENMKEFKGVIGDLDKCRSELQELRDAFKNNPELIELKRQKKEIDQKRKKLQKLAEKTGDTKVNKQAEAELAEMGDMIECLRFMRDYNQLEAESKRLKEEANVRLSKIELLKVELAQEKI
jgi:hypothetical protein